MRGYTCRGSLRFRPLCAVVSGSAAASAPRSTCGGRWPGPTRRTPPWRSTWTGTSRATRGSSRRSRPSTYARTKLGETKTVLDDFCGVGLLVASSLRVRQNRARVSLGRLVLALGRRDDLDLHRRRRERRELFGHALADAGVHGGAAREDLCASQPIRRGVNQGLLGRIDQRGHSYDPSTT